MWDPFSSSTLNQSVSENHCLLTLYKSIVLKKQIQCLKFMIKQRSDWGLDLWFHLKRFQLDTSTYVRYFNLYPLQAFVVFLFLVISHHLPHIISLAQTQSVTLNNSFLLGLSVVTQGTLQVNNSASSNLNSKTTETKLCKGAKSIFHHIAPL